MNIAFEISPLLLASGSFGDKSGVYRYVTGLITALEKINKNNKHKIVLFSFNRSLLFSEINPCLYEIINNKSFLFLKYFDEPIGEPVVGSYIKNKMFQFFLVKQILKVINKIFKIKYYYDYFREQVHEKNYLKFLKSEFKKNKITHIVHSNTSFKKLPGFVNLQIIYDLTPLLFPLNHRYETLDLFRRQIEFSKDFCEGIICISKSTKNDLLKYYPTFKEKKIEIIYPGTDENLVNNDYQSFYEDIVKILKTNKQSLLKNKYLIYFGTFEPRKNIVYLVKSFVDLQNEKSIPNDFKLLLVGGEGWGNIKCKIKNYINEEFPLLSKRNIVVLDYIADKYLYGLVKNAYATVYPSLYEGFGLPVLESMNLGTPVISSNNSSILEVGGNAILYSKVSDYADLKDKIKLLINDPILARNLSLRGLEQSKKFNWEKSGKDVYEFLNSI